jgi:predicted AAA+ superfamily ATPase
MIPRAYGPALRALLRQFPAVTILGPRQCGKTTFIRQALARWRYVDLERPSDVAPLAADPQARLDQLGDHVILDEAQRLPEVFPVLRGVIDRQRSRRGRYALLGSASPALVREISESLAGRTAFLDLPPFRWDELAGAGRTRSLDALWLRGGFPDAFLARDDRARHEWMEAYSRAFVERDLPVLGVSVSAPQMRRLWTMLAHVNGGLWNASQLAASLGVSYHTVDRYVDILEQAFLIRKLQPYFANLGKRLVKRPKLYFRDTGLLHYFLGIRSREDLDVHPARGASWEAFVVDQIISAHDRVYRDSRAWFWRTAQGDEVDLLIEVRGRLVPFEIKLHSAPAAADAKGLRRCMADLRLDRGYLVHAGHERYSLGDGVTAVPARDLLRRPSAVRTL